MERERSIQDGFARAENRVLTFDTDENFSQAVRVVFELAQPGQNGCISLESILVEKGINFEVKQVR